MSLSIFGKLLKPVLLPKALGPKHLQLGPRRIISPQSTTLMFKQHDLSGTRIMSSSSTNYHYHDKPQVHKHDKLWLAERYLSWALLGVLPAAWFVPHPFMDYAVATSLVVHVHWGVEATVIDYIRPAIFGPALAKAAVALVYVLSILAASGLFIFNWTGIGLTQALKMLADI